MSRTSSNVRIVERSSALRLLNPHEIWRWRELFVALTVRDIAVRYKQTAVGIAWAVLQPVAMVAVFSLLFGAIGNVPTGDLPYPLFAFAAMVPWQVFSRALLDGSLSLVNNRALITKVYFPRVLVPAAGVCGAAVDFAVTFVVLVLMMLWFGVSPGLGILLVPLLLLFTLLASLSVALWLSALNVLYRDVQFVLPFLVQIWLFITPVLYPAAIVPERWRWLYAFNPMVAVTESFRWALLGGLAPDPVAVAVSATMVVVLLVGGLAYFRYVERQMVDWI